MTVDALNRLLLFFRPNNGILILGNHSASSSITYIDITSRASITTLIINNASNTINTINTINTVNTINNMSKLSNQ